MYGQALLECLDSLSMAPRLWRERSWSHRSSSPVGFSSCDAQHSERLNLRIESRIENPLALRPVIKRQPEAVLKSTGGAVIFVDRDLKCVDCGSEFVFTAGEQLFFHDKQFVNDPKRCKQCKSKRNTGESRVRAETRTTCSECGASTTVPFKPTQGRPVLCRSCFQKQQAPK